MIKFPPKRILVPMDVSGPSFSALATAKAIARRCGASLDVVYIQEKGFSVPVFYPDGVIAGMPDIRGVQNSFRKWCAERLRQAVRDFPSSRVRVRTLWGPPADKLAGLARGRAAGLVVMGTHGHAGLQRFLQGSVAEAVARRATLPVLAVRERSGPPRFSRILVPCNMTPYAGKALAYALDFARGLGSSVEVLYVAEPGGDATAADRLRRHVESIVGGRRAGELRLRMAQGDPRQVIIDQARRGKFDMIALSAHRRPFSSDFVIGSTVERILRHSPIPVLAVPSIAKANWKEVRFSISGVPGESIRLPV